MATNLMQIYDEIIERAKEAAIKIRDEYIKEGETAISRTNKEFGAYQQMVIRDIFKGAVDSFYNDYKPKEYEKRRYSLYDSLQLQTNDSGMVSTGLMIGNDAPNYLGLFNDSIPTTRKGGSLFNTVFVEGWHGGSTYINTKAAIKWGAHPSPGTPYYRKGGMLKEKNGKRYYYKYAKWGRMAERTNQGGSPYEIISRELLDAEKGIIREERKNIFYRNCNAACKNAESKAKDIWEKAFG